MKFLAINFGCPAVLWSVPDSK